MTRPSAEFAAVVEALSPGVRIERHVTLAEERVAVFSDEDDPSFRYWLRITWDNRLPPFVALMLNPSTADHLENDPTVERMQRRALAKRAGSLIVLNAFAWRETDRLKMLQVSDPVGPANDNYIALGLRMAKATGGTVMIGWGNEGGHRDRHLRVIELLQAEGVEATCLALCANGQPIHPLYQPLTAPLLPWPPEPVAA